MAGAQRGRRLQSDTAPADASVVLTAGDFEVGICPEVGGSLTFFRTSAETEILKTARRGGDAAASACFPMVPFCNRVRDRRFVWNGREHLLLPNSRDGRQTAHGFGWRTAWEVRARAYDTVHLRHDHIAGAWPWDYSADQRITLDAGGLTIALSVTNHSADTMPAGLGLHPYFPLSSRSRVAFCARTVEAVDRSGFPVPDPEGLMILSDAADGRLDPHIGNRYIGGVIGDVRIGDPTEPHALILRDSGCSTLALHVEQDSRLFSLEPMSHAIGALNASDPPSSGIRTLRPGERMSLTVRMDVASVW